MAKIKGHKGLFRPDYVDKAGNRCESPIIWGQWWCKRCPKHPNGNGGRHRESLETEKIKDAAVELAKKKAEPKKPVVDPSEITVDYLLDRYLNKTDIEKSTLCDYEGLCKKHLRPALGFHLATDLVDDGMILEKFVKDKKAEPVTRRGKKETGRIGYSASRINSMLSLISGAYEHMHEELRGIRPKITKLENHAVRKDYFTKENTASLLKHLPPDIVRPLLVLDHTAWRSWSEVFSRKRYHWDKERAVLILEPGEAKHPEAREFPVNDYLAGILQEQEAATLALERKLGKIIPWLFHDSEGNAFGEYYPARDCYKPTRYFRRHWKAALAASKLFGRRVHDFRRSGIRRYGESGIDDATGMKLSGHASIRVYHAYKSIGAEDEKRASEKLSVHSHGQSTAKVRGKKAPAGR